MPTNLFLKWCSPTSQSLYQYIATCWKDTLKEELLLKSHLPSRLQLQGYVTIIFCASHYNFMCWLNSTGNILKVFESQWKFIIPVHNLVINLLVVGLVREPDVVFLPTILIIRNSLVGFTITDTVMLANNENECLKFEFKGNSLCNESGKTPVIMEPEFGSLKPRSETPIKWVTWFENRVYSGVINVYPANSYFRFIYTPIEDGPLSFKIFCSITYMTKHLTLCVNALSHSIKPKVTYFLVGNEHLLNSEAITNIHLDQVSVS